ncbi:MULTISPECIES: glucose-6-phosphate isomerase [Micromonospora]|uniref:Glucose-6-phosphate isomerase n=1 Tax=Micromonospora solifontis TaxID=2487138 RepID=A0ABX9WIQ7_9ACTN|nr:MULTISPECIES: glucose-6-phosphate isomerase [Micromonospora]NES16680.1 glucose-6-phosphate isomerase [Micromonospora sp. PPF5-17B]NES37348.1 glucose-6-phosphate isomerase [Micromonospora solifontis]NES56764.1 glucose-6-phosphate isomerase [Micromonospora sp. PPF5-6]RNL98460.1 glucose-6-phosphate isomerase [Micromonospora solifontis]
MSDLLAGPAEVAGGLSVRGAAAVDAAAPASTRAALLARDVPARLAAGDPTLWGPDAAATAKVRLGWLDTHRRSRELLPQLAELVAELADLDHVVLAGMGGAALAPEVITRALGRPLTVLDTTDPGQVRAALADRLERTVVVVSSKCGSSVETDSLRRAYWQAFLDAGMSEAETARHFVVVTDPGSPLEATAAELGVVTILADPEVASRYSALTAFGLVPAALAGVPVTDLLDDADALAGSLGRDRDNPALALGAALGAAATTGRATVALAADGTGADGLGDWIEQLLAESTGKAGVGLLPVVLESPDAPGGTAPDVLTVSCGGALTPGRAPGAGVADLAVNGPLGAHFLAWEYATAVAAVVLGVDPFDQPDVAGSKENTARVLAAGAPAETASFTDGAVEVYAPVGAPGDLVGVLRWLLDGLGDDGYLAVTAYLDRRDDAAVAGLRPALARATGRPVTFGWAPRCLHSTGQYHKGGPRAGSHLQLTGAVTGDLPVPGRPYTFGELQAAQAAGDRQALAGRERPVLRLHLTERAAGVAQLLDAAGRTRT